MRPAEGKGRFIVCDEVGATWRHGPITGPIGSDYKWEEARYSHVLSLTLSLPFLSLPLLVRSLHPPSSSPLPLSLPFLPPSLSCLLPLPLKLNPAIPSPYVPPSLPAPSFPLTLPMRIVCFPLPLLFPQASSKLSKEAARRLVRRCACSAFMHSDASQCPSCGDKMKPRRNALRSCDANSLGAYDRSERSQP